MSKGTKIGRQIIVSTIVHILVFLLGFVGIKILTNTLSLSNYGVYSLIFATIGVLSICLELGFHNYLVTKVPGEEKTKGFSYFTSTFIFKLIVVSVVVILATTISIPLVKYFNWNISSQIIIFSALILLLNTLRAESLRFHGLRKRLEFTLIMHLFAESLWILQLFLLWWFVRKITLDQVLLMRLLPVFLVLFVSFWVMKKKEEGVGKYKLFDKKIVRESLVFGAPLVILGFGYYLLISADRYIIAFLLSTADVGYYSLVYSLVNIVYGLTSSISGVSFYHFAEAYNLGKNNNSQFLRAKDIFNCSLRLSLIIGLFLCIIFTFLRLPLIQILSTKEYLVAAKTMLFLSPSPVLLILTSLLQQVLVLEKQRRILIKAYILAPLLNVILNFALIPQFGINGAAVATVASYLFIFLFFLVKVKKYHILEFAKFQFLKLGVCLLVAITPIYFLNPTFLLELFYSGLLSAVIYFLTLSGLKVITKKDWNILWGHGREPT